MNLTEILFYGGIAGMAGTALLAALLFGCMRAWKKKLKRQLEEAYGEEKK